MHSEPGLRLDYWSIHEIACWLAGESPATNDADARKQVLEENANSKAGRIYRLLKDAAHVGAMKDAAHVGALPAIVTGWYGHWRVLPSDFIKWAALRDLSIPAWLMALAQEEPASVQSDSADGPDADKRIAALFDGVGTAQLEKMFVAGGKWKSWSERAKRNGLIVAKTGRAQFNPYLAAKWWLNKQDPEGWDQARCMRKLGNNLPSRSKDFGYLLTEDLE